MTLYCAVGSKQKQNIHSILLLTEHIFESILSINKKLVHSNGVGAPSWTSPYISKVDTILNTYYCIFVRYKSSYLIRVRGFSTKHSIIMN